MKLNARRIEDLDLKNRRVLVRVDFNCPQDDMGRLTDDTRIRAPPPTPP
ncbi:MAG: phosphoglycerate kinase, partial [Planctomycetia bacterium]